MFTLSFVGVRSCVFVRVHGYVSFGYNLSCVDVLAFMCLNGRAAYACLFMLIRECSCVNQYGV